MKNLIEIPTVGGRGTLSGGIALRINDKGEFVVHNWNDEPDGTRVYWSGAYMYGDNEQTKFADAMDELARRVERQTHYEGGGEIDLAAFTGKVDA